MVPSGMRSAGQDDTYTLAITLKEEPKFAYFLTAGIAMHDFLETGSKINGYSAELALFGHENQQGFKLSAGSPNNPLVGATAMRSIDSNSDSFKIGGNFKDKKMLLTFSRDEKKNNGEIWRKNFFVALDQNKIIDENYVPGGEIKLHFGMAGKQGGFVGETILTTMGSKAVEINLNMELESHRGAIHIIQAVKPG